MQFLIFWKKAASSQGNSNCVEAALVEKDDDD